MEVYQFQAVSHALLLQQFQCVEQFGTGESELAGVAAAFLPFAASAAGQFDADAEVGAHVEFLGYLGDDFQFVQFLHYDKDSLAHLLGQQCQLDIALVLVSVADDE